MKEEFIPWAKPDIGEEEVKAVADSVRSTWIGGNGPLVKEFAKRFREKIGVRFALPVNNGTSALICGFQGLQTRYNLKYGAVPTFTFLATVNVSVYILDMIKLYDADFRTWNMKIPTNQSLDIIIPVDVAGLPVEYDDLKILKKPILADSAEAVGSKYKGNYVGSQADIHIFSFHSAKVITTGEGGMITTNDKDLYEKMTAITNQGYAGEKKPWEYLHQMIGFNYRMAEPQAALGLVQLKKLDRYVKERNERANIYKDILGELALYQRYPSHLSHNYFIFGMLVPRIHQEPFCREMLKHEIQVKVTWRPAHLQPFYRRYSTFKDEKLPNSEWLWKRIISLPNFNGMTEEQAKYVGETAKQILKNLKKESK